MALDASGVPDAVEPQQLFCHHVHLIVEQTSCEACDHRGIHRLALAHPIPCVNLPGWVRLGIKWRTHLERGFQSKFGVEPLPRNENAVVEVEQVAAFAQPVLLCEFPDGGPRFGEERDHERQVLPRMCDSMLPAFLAGTVFGKNRLKCRRPDFSVQQPQREGNVAITVKAPGPIVCAQDLRAAVALPEDTLHQPINALARLRFEPHHQPASDPARLHLLGANGKSEVVRRCLGLDRHGEQQNAK